MDKRLQIEKYIEKHNMYDTLKFYKEPSELMIILDIVIIQKEWHSIDDVIINFPNTKDYDPLKINVLNLYGSLFDDYTLKNIIRSISSDDNKLEILNKFIDTFSQNYHVYQIINSFKSDEVKCRLFEKYHSYFNGNGFSDYLRSLKSDVIRTSEFDKYISQYNIIRLDWIAGSYSNDNDRIKFYEDNFSHADVEHISYFIRLLSKDESKVKFLDKYSEYISPYNMWYITSSLEKLETKKDILKRYANKMESRDIKNLLSSIPDINLRIELLDEIVDIIDSNNLIDLIIEIPNISERITIFKKYINKFNSNDIVTMYIYLDESYKKLFLDEYIDLFTNYSLFRIYRLDDWIDDKQDKMLKKYIKHFNPLSLAEVIKNFRDYGEIYDRSNDINVIANQFIKMSKNKNNLRTIYNSLAMTDSEYFVNNLLKDENKIFSDDEQKICDTLFKQNPYLYNTFVFDLLDIKELRNNLPFLAKLSKYPKVAYKICELHKRNINKSKVLILILDFIYQQDINHDKISIDIINEISNSKYDKLLSNLDINLMDEKIMLTLMFKLLKGNNIYNEKSGSSKLRGPEKNL